jgi:lysyl-tRNA synthetase class 2
MSEETREDFMTRSKIVWPSGSTDDAGFVVVETPVLQPLAAAPSHPFVALERARRWALPTHHDGLYLKRLIVGGLERVYEIGKDFRNEGVSYKNQPEFTMLEWYEAYADYEDTMARLEELLEHVAREVLATTVVQFKGHEVDLKAPWVRLPFVQALERLELWTRDPDELRAWLEERGVDTAADKDWAQLVDHAFSHFVEPSLVAPTIVHGYPIELSPFARTTDDDPMLTERFEYFAAGMELGNAFPRSPIRQRLQRARPAVGARRGVRATRPRRGLVWHAADGRARPGIDRLTMPLTGVRPLRCDPVPGVRPED